MIYSAVRRKILLVAVLLLACPVFAAGSDSPNLFGVVSDAVKPVASDGVVVVRSRPVQVDLTLLQSVKSSMREGRAVSKPFFLNLFDDVVLETTIRKTGKTFFGGDAYVGTIQGEPYSQVILIAKRGIVSGNISVPGHFYQLRYGSGGLHRVQEIDQTQFPSELPPVPVTVQTESDRFSEDTATDSADLIDVMVVYTADARDGAGGTTVMETLIDLIVAESNIGYENSGVLQRLRLVRTTEVVYSEVSFDWAMTIERLRGTADGYMDDVHAMRDICGADEVVLIVNNTASCGIAYVMQTVSTAFASAAFAVVSRTCATGYYSFAHEMGHNMGCTHDRYTVETYNDALGAYNYSYGYQAPDGAFRTIMAYTCPNGGCSRVNYWSNPDISYGGQPMGVYYTDPEAADNRRSLNNTASTVANFRQAVVPPVKALPWLMLLLGE